MSKPTHLHNLLIHELRPSCGPGPHLGGIGLAWAHDRKEPSERTGSIEGTVEGVCDAIVHWGAAAVLSVTEVGVDRITLPLDAFSQGAAQRHMRWYHLPVRRGHAPGPAFEDGWVSAGAQLRALLRQGCRIVVHGEGPLERSAMIIARLFAELGCDVDQALEQLYAFRPELFPSGSPARAMIGHVREQAPIPEPQPSTAPAAIRDRAVGALLGLAAGDALGTTLEFRPRGSYEPLTDMVGGGPFRLRPGEWTDDTAMALALAETLQEHERLDDWPLRQDLIRQAQADYAAGKQNRLARERLRKLVREAARGEYDNNPHLFERALMQRFTAWMDRGAFSCNGRCFDIGMTVRAALGRFKRTGHPIAGSSDPMSAGNGSLMRLAPVAVRFWHDRDRLRDYAARQSRTTHGAPEAVDACVAYAELLADAIAGKPAGQVLAPREGEYAGAIGAILAGSWRGKRRQDIRASGYVAHSLEAALWSVGRCLAFGEAVLTAANLGEDADTTAAIAGQLAGALHGASGIPQPWRQRLAWHDRIVSYAEALLPEEIRGAR